MQERTEEAGGGIQQPANGVEEADPSCPELPLTHIFPSTNSKSSTTLPLSTLHGSLKPSESVTSPFSFFIMGVKDVLTRKTGVIVGDDVLNLFKYAQEKNFAIPAINVTSSSTVVAALEAARDLNAPIILQTSQGGAAYFAGKVRLHTILISMTLICPHRALPTRPKKLPSRVPLQLHNTFDLSLLLMASQSSCTPITVRRSFYHGSMA
jgi:Fructose-bisphosphate aldolase class-II